MQLLARRSSDAHTASITGALSICAVHGMNVIEAVFMKRNYRYHEVLHEVTVTM